MTSSHTHLHLNVQRTMSREKITADLEKAFGLRPDTIGVDEMETSFHRTAFRTLAIKHGYYPATWDGAAGAVALAVRQDYGRLLSQKSTFAAPGKSGVSPNRYVNRIRVERHLDKLRVMVNEHHAYSSGWTGSKSLDILRQARWYIGMRVLTSINRTGAKGNDLVIGSADLNRPPSTFPKGKVLAGLLSKRGLTSTGYAHTDGTHGKTIFDYVWWLSRHRVVTPAKASTPSFNSDHDGVLVTLEW